MNRDEVIALMSTSTNSKEWNDNCAKVKAACGNDYPDFWYSTMISSGLMDKILGQGSSDIKIKVGSFDN